MWQTSGIRITSKQRTKGPFPKCPMFGGSTVWQFSQFAFFSELTLWGDSEFPYSVQHTAVAGHVYVCTFVRPDQSAQAALPIYVYMEHAQFIEVS